VRVQVSPRFPNAAPPKRTTFFRTESYAAAAFVRAAGDGGVAFLLKAYEPQHV
jgi:hypothetical protein